MSVYVYTNCVHRSASVQVVYSITVVQYILHINLYIYKVRACVSSVCTCDNKKWTQTILGSNTGCGLCGVRKGIWENFNIRRYGIFLMDPSKHYTCTLQLKYQFCGINPWNLSLTFVFHKPDILYGWFHICSQVYWLLLINMKVFSNRTPFCPNCHCKVVDWFKFIQVLPYWAHLNTSIGWYS